MTSTEKSFRSQWPESDCPKRTDSIDMGNSSRTPSDGMCMLEVSSELWGKG